MGRVTVHLESKSLTLAHLAMKRLPGRITEGAQEAVQESGDAIKDQVADTVGVHTGRLKARIRVRLIGAKGLTADVGWFDHDTYYAQFVEFGTSSITANPVLTRASEEEKGRFAARVREHIREKL